MALVTCLITGGLPIKREQVAGDVTDIAHIEMPSMRGGTMHPSGGTYGVLLHGLPGRVKPDCLGLAGTVADAGCPFCRPPVRPRPPTRKCLPFF